MPGDKNSNHNKDNNRVLERLAKKVDEISYKLEQSKIDDYVNYLKNPKKLFWPNFLSGLYRGFGIAIGFTLLGAIVVYFLQYIITLNLPGISEFIGKIVKLVEFYVSTKG